MLSKVFFENSRSRWLSVFWDALFATLVQHSKEPKSLEEEPGAPLLAWGGSRGHWALPPQLKVLGSPAQPPPRHGRQTFCGWRLLYTIRQHRASHLPLGLLSGRLARRWSETHRLKQEWGPTPTNHAFRKHPRPTPSRPTGLPLLLPRPLPHSAETVSLRSGRHPGRLSVPAHRHHQHALNGTSQAGTAHSNVCTRHARPSRWGHNGTKWLLKWHFQTTTSQHLLQPKER